MSGVISIPGARAYAYNAAFYRAHGKQRNNAFGKIKAAAFLIAQGRVKVRGEDLVLRPMIGYKVIAKKMLNCPSHFKLLYTMSVFIKKLVQNDATPFISIKQYNVLLKMKEDRLHEEGPNDK